MACEEKGEVSELGAFIVLALNTNVWGVGEIMFIGGAPTGFAVK